MRIKVLVFDVDGVLVEPWGFAKFLQREHPQIAVQTVEFFRGVFSDCLIGKADMREELPSFLARWGWPHSLDEFLRLWFEAESATDARLLAAVQQARAAGIRAVVATNQERHRLAYLREQMDFGTHFDALYASAHLGMTKPAARFFEAVTTDLAVPVDQVIFWDDSQANVDAARAHGWQSELYSDYGVFSEQFREITGLDAPRSE
jgi:putative hydrolase of the HAD superfamily